jgi:hypothetical protein
MNLSGSVTLSPASEGERGNHQGDFVGAAFHRRSGSGHSWDHAADAGDLRAYIGGVGAIEQQEVVTGEISQNVAGAAPRELPLLAMLRTELANAPLGTDGARRLRAGGRCNL